MGAEPRPCALFHPNPADTAGRCRLCWLVLNDGDLQEIWLGPDMVTSPRGTRREYAMSPAGTPLPPAPPGCGPGTELKALLASLGLTPDGCSCNANALRMNAMGPAGCRERKAEIVAWLREEREKRGWGESLRAGLRAVATGLAFRLDPADILGSLVEEAIRRAEAQAPG